MEVDAVPATAGDVDLYLQREDGEGSWSQDLTAGESSSTEHETLSANRLDPGRYRIKSHLWAGAPMTRVDLLITFFNGRDQPGTPD